MSEGWDYELEEEEQSDEIVIVVPTVDSGSDWYVCAECGYDLTEIPTYNRFHCENCGLHY